MFLLAGTWTNQEEKNDVFKFIIHSFFLFGFYTLYCILPYILKKNLIFLLFSMMRNEVCYYYIIFFLYI